MLAVMPYLTSSPTSASRSLLIAARAPVGGDPAMRVGLELDVLARRRQVEADQRRRARDAEDAVDPPVAAGSEREVRPLVLAADRRGAAECPMSWSSPGLVANRLERNRDLRRPAPVEAAGPHLPHRIPVGVRVAFVGHELVGEAAERVGVEVEAVAAIVERVEQHAEHVVLAQLAGVAAQLVGGPLVGRRRVLAPARDVDEVVVEQHPGFGALGRRLRLRPAPSG